MLEMCFFANIVEIATGSYVENVFGGFFFANIVEIVVGSYVGAPTWRLAHLLWSSVLKRREGRSPPLYPPNISLDRLSPLLIHTPQLPVQPTYLLNRVVF